MLLNKINELRVEVKKWRAEGFKVGLVPTMGALHEGHLSLIKKAKSECDKVVVSVFVNPIQFGPSEDFDKYPRTLDKDVELCDKENVDIVFAPTPKEMYGDCRLSNDCLTYVCPPYFYVDKLCGKSRVGHFDGVCTVVMKLFNIVQPDCAFFGQKDALVLSQILNNIVACYNRGITDVEALKETAYSYLTNKHDLEYLEILNRDTLEEETIVNDNSIALIACKVDGVRLIDNVYFIGD